MQCLLDARACSTDLTCVPSAPPNQQQTHRCAVVDLEVALERQFLDERRLKDSLGNISSPEQPGPALQLGADASPGDAVTCSIFFTFNLRTRLNDPNRLLRARQCTEHLGGFERRMRCCPE